jgi:predicted DNA-binding protein
MSYARKSVRYQERIAFRLPVSLTARLRQAADAREARISELVREAIREKLERIEARPP